VLFFALVLLGAFLVAPRGPGEGNVKFYLTVAWFLVFAYSLALSVMLPVRTFAREKREKLLQVLGARPISRFGLLWARFLAALGTGGAAVLIGCVCVWAGVKITASRMGVDLSSLSGSHVYPLAPREVPESEVAALARELARDRTFLRRHGPEGILRIARSALSARRLGDGDETVIVWEGLPPGAPAGRIRFLPRIYPPWSQVQATFEVGGKTYTRDLSPDVPAAFAYPAGAVDSEGRLRVRISIKADSNGLVTFRVPDGLSVYVPEMGFGENLLRAGALVMALVGAVAAVGVLVGALLSYPVALLAVMVTVLLGLGSTLFTRAVQEFTGPLEHRHAGEPAHEYIPLPVREVWRKVMLYVLSAAPSLGSFDPGTELAEGRSISSYRILKGAFSQTFLRGGTALLLAWVFFRKRELGRRR